MLKDHFDTCFFAGTAFWNLLSVTPVFDANGRLTSYIGVQSDITELIHSKARSCPHGEKDPSKPFPFCFCSISPLSPHALSSS